MDAASKKRDDVLPSRERAAQRIEPTAADGSSARFNPLMQVRLGSHREVADVQNIMTMIVDPDGKGLKDHWQKSAQALLVGVALHVLYAEPNKSLSGIVTFLSDPGRSSDKTMQLMLETGHVRSGPDADGAAAFCHPPRGTPHRRAVALEVF